MRSIACLALAALGLTIACSSSAPATTGGAGGEPPDAKTNVPDAKTNAPDAKARDAAAWPKRPKPAPLVADPRKIDFAKFRTLAHSRHPEHGWIRALENGGCGVYLNDGTQRPPGSFPAAHEVECPPEMLAPQWGHCTGPGTLQRSEDNTECICSPGTGDPPPPAFRVPCPPLPTTAPP